MQMEIEMVTFNVILKSWSEPDQNFQNLHVR